MKLDTFIHQKPTHVGAELDGALVKLPFADLLELIRGGKTTLSVARQTVARAKPKTLVPLRKAKLLAPIPRPGQCSRASSGGFRCWSCTTRSFADEALIGGGDRRD